MATAGRKKEVKVENFEARVTRLWNNPVYRGWFYQAGAMALIIWAGVWLFSNTLSNLEARGISSGFGFLSREAGFGIIQHLIPYAETSSFFTAFWVGLLNTVLIAILGIIFATIVGFVIGIMRLSNNFVIRGIASIYVEAFRNIPVLLQILFWYVAVLKPLPSPRDLFSDGDEVWLSLTNRGIGFATPVPEGGFGFFVLAVILALAGAAAVSVWAKRRQSLTGKIFPVGRVQLGLVVFLPLAVFLLAGKPLHFDPGVMGRFRVNGGSTIIIELIALFLALSIYTAAFIAEIVRAGIQSVGHGQTEAAGALGLKGSQIMRLIILPQALRVIIPPLTNQYLNLTKNSSLAAAIAYPDLVSVFAGTALNQTGQAIEIMGMTLAVYLFLSLVTSAGMNTYNKRLALVER